jgi:transcriptional regulator with XRE-family HTH domain
MTPHPEHSQPRLVAMGDEDDAHARGEEIKRRRLSHGIKSVREFAEKTGPVGSPHRISREAITAAEAGEASAGTYDRLESWLDRFEYEISSEREGLDESAQVIEIHVLGIYGIDELVIKAPPSESDRARDMVAELLRQVREREDS